MILKNHLRPTAIKTNARFRGPTELEKYSNFVLETAHDLKLLGSVMDRNDFVAGHRGHTDFIQDNFAAYVNGGAPITAHVSTATTIAHPTGSVFGDVDLLDSNWATYGGCQKTASPEGVRLTSPGLQDPAGIANQKYVEEGDILYVRLGVRLLAGSGAAFSLGSHDINQGEGDMTKFEIPENGSTIYIDKRLYCRHREPISVNIDVHNVPAVLQGATVEVVDVDVQYLSENHLTVQPVDTVVKAKMNTLESTIRNIINNI